MLDIGAFPGSFVRLARAAYGPELRLAACGMPVTERFLQSLGAEGVEFRACQFDPSLVGEGDLHVGLPFDSGSMDVIACMEVVEHLYSLKTLVTECARVLAPGGLLYITTNNVLDREGLVRVLRDRQTNLDPQLKVTSIWAEPDEPYRRHVRFYSAKQLGEVGALVGFETHRVDFFTHYEDPDVFNWDDRGPLGALRKQLRGRGDRPPINLRRLANVLRYLGPRALRRAFDNRLEIVLRKPEAGERAGP
jgi:SAM-dependent methyltransferase